VTFPVLDKIHVKGPEQAPLYAGAFGPEAKFPGDVKWNLASSSSARTGKFGPF